MAEGQGPGPWRPRRVGSRALLVLADSVNVSILRELAEGTRAAVDLLGSLEGVSRGTFYNRLRDLEDLGLIARERRPTVPPTADCRLTGVGRQLLSVGDRLEAWLGRRNGERIELGGPVAANTIKALAAGWESMLLHLLAEQPRSLAELEPFMRDFGYRKLERTTVVLIAVGLVERPGSKGRMNPYALTRWACAAVTPLVAAIRWELRQIPERGVQLARREADALRTLADHCNLDPDQTLAAASVL